MSSLSVLHSGIKGANPKRQLIKRLVDLGVCLLLIPILTPLMVIIGIMIILDSRGPILFRQTRIGKDGRSFQICKFRTMRCDFDDTHHRTFMKQYIEGQIASWPEPLDAYKPPVQNQVTPIGRFLRRTSLDELPQLINVFVGHMSLVGPRPHVPWEVEFYQAWHYERLEVKPGITGLAQINGRSRIPFDQMVQHDLEYVRSQSLILDFKILFKTVEVVIKGEGAG